MNADTDVEQRSPGHPRIATALLIVATLLSFLAIFSIWVNRQALNTDNWTNTSEKLLQNKDVQSQLSIFLADQLFANVDVQAELQKALPPRLQPLAGPAAGGLHQLGQQVAERALATPQVQQLWAEANRAAHEDLLTIINGGGTALSTNGGTVTLDLGPLVAQLGSQLGVGSNLSSKLPADAGSLTILRSDQLSTAQDIAKLIRYLAIVLTLLAFALYGLAVYLAGPRRRQALRSVGFGFIVAGVLALVVRKFSGSTVTGALASSDSVKPAVDATWSIATSLLVTVAVSAITFGILVVIGAWLAGPTRLALALRREAAPCLRERRVAAYAVVAFVFLALILWAPVAAFHKPIGLLLLAALMVLGTEALRRQTAAEFPNADFGGFGERIGAAVPGRGGPPPQAPAKESKVDELERLSTLKEQGALSDEEFESAKAEVLGP
jgi:hypothetical protein